MSIPAGGGTSNHSNQTRIYYTAKDFYSTFNREKNAKLDTSPRVTMYHYAQYLSPLAGLSGNLYAGKILEVNSLEHLLSIVVDNNNVLLDGGSL